MALTCDFLVLGSGIAGLTFALEAAKHGDVLVVSKRAADESNTKYAQGGIAAVLADTDTFESHIEDTLVAGAGLCHERVVELCVKDAPARIAELQKLGTRFDQTSEKQVDLHLEGGHSARRVAHSADATGREVERALLEAARASKRVRISSLPNVVDACANR